MDSKIKKSSATVFGDAASRAKAEQEAIVSRAVSAWQAEEPAPERKQEGRYARANINVRVPQRLHAMMKLHSAATGESIADLVYRVVDKELGDDPTALADKLVSEARGGK